MPIDITQLAEYGLTGVCLALIILFGLVIKWFVKLVSNHIAHNTEILTKLSGKIDYDIKTEKDTQKVLDKLDRFLIKQNGNK